MAADPTGSRVRMRWRGVGGFGTSGDGADDRAEGPVALADGGLRAVRLASATQHRGDMRTASAARCEGVRQCNAVLRPPPDCRGRTRAHPGAIVAFVTRHRHAVARDAGDRAGARFVGMRHRGRGALRRARHALDARREARGRLRAGGARPAAVATCAPASDPRVCFCASRKATVSN